MLIIGEITKIETNTNRFSVRLPILENPGGEKFIIHGAVACIPPGIYGGYQKGDPVIVGFELNRLNYPIILGKLYEGAVKEEKNSRIDKQGVVRADVIAADQLDLNENALRALFTSFNGFIPK